MVSSIINFNKEIEQPTGKRETTVLQITTDGANIRASASLDSDIVAVATPDTDLTYEGVSNMDESQIEWYQVKTLDGTTGWISSKIVQEK